MLGCLENGTAINSFIGFSIFCFEWFLISLNACDFYANMAASNYGGVGYCSQDIGAGYLMSNVKIRTGLLLTSIFFSSLLSLTSLANDAKTAFKVAYRNYQAHFDAGDFEASLPYAKQTYELSSQLYELTSLNRLAAIENYALNLRVVDNNIMSQAVFIELLNAYEKKYGRHGVELLPVLGDLEEISLVLSDKKAHDYKLRKSKLYLRHNSSEFVRQLNGEELSTTQHAKNMLSKVEKHLKRNFVLYESQHWSVIHHKDQTKQVKKVAKVMEKSYQSVLSFLVAFNVRSTPIDKKMTAVYFGSRGEYASYLSTLTAKKSAERSDGIYVTRAKTIFFFNRGFDDKGKVKMVRPSTVAHEVAHQIMFDAGLQTNAVNQPAWLVEGLASSFEFYDVKKEFGPHTENYSAGRIFQIQKIKDEGNAPSLESIVMLTAQAREDRTKAQVAAFYPYGSMLVRYLYDFYPEEFKKYFIILAKSKRSASASDRRKMFKKAFGDPLDHNKPFQEYVNSLVEEAVPAIEQYRRHRMEKKKRKKEAQK